MSGLDTGDEAGKKNAAGAAAACVQSQIQSKPDVAELYDGAAPAKPTGRQAKRTLAMLRRGPVTTIDLHDAYMLAAAGRISELKALGFEIFSKRLPNGVASYSLVEKKGGHAEPH